MVCHDVILFRHSSFTKDNGQEFELEENEGKEDQTIISEHRSPKINGQGPIEIEDPIKEATPELKVLVIDCEKLARVVDTVWKRGLRRIIIL